ncbi:MAG: D-tyrosyl-tRNA(Tyr) deacylase [Lachnospiraceae bacterium]|nr:D-tyrosyl-tRNA(Tyr) deacylase [Lachnospiraceae bacterium]
MKFVIQRVSEASVAVEGKEISRIGKGFLVLVGICEKDTPELADKMIKKMVGLRIFEDHEGKTNLNLETVQGELLLVSQFTLYADCRKGNRPSFIKAGAPDRAEELYNYILDACRQQTGRAQGGQFGAHMEISLINDGPFTVILDSEELFGQP